MKPDIEIMAQKMEAVNGRWGDHYDYDSTVAALKYWYDGYHFSKNMTNIYCPWSLVSAFAMGDIMNFWFSTGTPTSLISILRTSSDISLVELEDYSRNGFVVVD